MNKKATNIEQLSLGLLKNETHVQFHATILAILLDELSSTEVATLELTTAIPLYEAALPTERTALNFIRKNSYTEKVEAQDKVRDKYFRGFHNTVKGMRDHFDAGLASHATHLLNAFSFYHTMPQKPLDDESAAMNKFIELCQQPEYHDDIVALSAEEWLDRLVDENNKYIELTRARYDETDGKTSLRMKDTRRETDKYYRGITQKMEIHVVMKMNAPVLNRIIKKLNVVIKHYKTILAQEQGRRKK